MRSLLLARTRHFRVLYRVFFLRVVDMELLSTDADPTRLVQQFATLFATISFFFFVPSLLALMSGGHVPIATQWTIEHFFLETTMTVAGLIAILNWESAFPDRRDLLVLSPLPVRTGTLLAAKVAALCAGPCLAAIAFNVFIGITWPLLLIAHGVGFFGSLRAWPAYWATLLLGTVFLVFSVLGIQGLASALLPRQLFLRLSAFLQAAAFCLLLSVYLLGPRLESPAQLIAPANQHVLAWLPAYWFLGLFEQLNGGMHPALAPLARRAWIALAVSFLAAFTSVLLAYVRTLPRTIEQPDILPARSFLRLPQIGNSLPSAITAFSLRTLLRSRQHRTILSAYLGIGIALVAGYIRTPFAGIKPVSSGISTTFLLASLLMVILTILALRVVSSMPITLRANWLIRLTQTRPAIAYQGAVRWSWLLLSLLPVLLVLAATFAMYPWRQVLGHLIAMLFLGAFLIELCLYGFRKIPFACSYLPGKANIHFVFWAFLLAFIRALKDAAEFEARMLRDPRVFLLAVLTIATATAAMRWHNATQARADEELVFEEEEPAQMVSLKLS
jgi:hypothetical protein